MILDLEQNFLKVSDPVQKIKMQKYLKNKFEFYGVVAPMRKIVEKKYLIESKKLDINQLRDLIFELHNFGKREMLYVAKGMALKNIKRLDYEFITFLVDLTLVDSWWENTDSYNAVIKRYFLTNKDELGKFIKFYSVKDNIWLKKISIICQLGFKGGHDASLVRLAIENTKNDDDFFVQKAIGWLLRDISKYDEDFVLKLLAENQFSNLVVTQATKNMG